MLIYGQMPSSADFVNTRETDSEVILAVLRMVSVTIDTLSTSGDRSSY